MANLYCRHRTMPSVLAKLADADSISFQCSYLILVSICRDCPRQRYWDILPYFSKKSYCYFEMTNFYHWNLIRICAILELVWNSPIVLQVQAYPCIWTTASAFIHLSKSVSVIRNPLWYKLKCIGLNVGLHCVKWTLGTKDNLQGPIQT